MSKRYIEEVTQLIDGGLLYDMIYFKDLDISFEFDIDEITNGHSGYTQKINIENTSCYKMSFNNLQISEDVRVVDSDIRNMTFTNCEFRVCKDNQSSLFVQAVAMEQLTFVGCTFNGIVDLLVENVKCRIEFENCIFEKDVIFSNLNLGENAEISLNGERALIKGDCIFRFCSIKDGRLDIRSDIDKTLRMSEINVGMSETKHTSCLSIGGCTIREVRFFKCNFHLIDIVNAELCDLREQMSSFNLLQHDAPRVFRDAAIKNNDDFNVQKYSAVLYNQILKGRAAFSDKVLLWLNKCSNAYGMSWLRGVGFTFAVTLILYFLLNYFGCENQFFVFDLKFRGFWEVCLGFFSLLDIFDLADTGIKLELTPAGKCMFFVGRIFIAYGIWQTIYAFYKFKK